MEDTIAAIATPSGTAGIGKIRISGPEAFKVSDLVFKGVKAKSLRDMDTYTAHYGYIVEPETQKKIDEVITIIFKTPGSFTGEDVVEFDCHGGRLVLQKIMEIILNNGARLAEPGEFSKRAFLNGRIDLSQAESIIDLINARTDKGLDIAFKQLNGKLYDKIEDIKNRLIVLLAQIEASIDFPEDEIEGFQKNKIGQRINNIIDDIKKLLMTSKQGRIYREGISTVIAGKPNVGKSSLLNYLLSENRAIVTDIPGTTRDIIEEVINIKGIPLKITDTAGFRETKDTVEKIGVEKTLLSLRNADLVLMLLDVNQGITKEDLQVYELIKNKPVIIIINKTDLPENIDRERVDNLFKNHEKLWISLKKEMGIDQLKEKIIEVVFNEEIDDETDLLISNIRHKEALDEALAALQRVEKAEKNRLAIDFLTIDLKDCLYHIGKITGETVSEDIVDQIFQDFCLGK